MRGDPGRNAPDGGALAQVGHDAPSGEGCGPAGQRRSNDIPEFFDWKLEGAVTSVKEQGECGSCYAFSAIGCLEGQNYIQHKKLIDLSAQQIIENVERNRAVFYPLFKDDFSIEAYKDRIERFIFFATNGCGDYYCYRVSEDGTVNENAIYIWEHEYIGDECCWKKVADSLAECITRYYHDEI